MSPCSVDVESVPEGARGATRDRDRAPDAPSCRHAAAVVSNRRYHAKGYGPMVLATRKPIVLWK